MPRARNIKPGLFKNELLGEADPIYSLLFVGLWTLADREGRLENRPKKIRAELFPYRFDIDVTTGLAWLMDNSFINIYEIDGVSYIQVNNWRRHQSPHHKEVDSVIPPEAKVENKDKKQGVTQAQPKHESSMNQASVNENASCPTDSLNLIPDSRSLIADDGEAQAPHANDNRERFEMFNGWTPSLDQQTEKALQNAGITQADFDEQLPKYIASVIDKGSQRTQHEWNSGFKASLMRFANSQKTFKRPMRKTLEQKAQEFIHG